MYTLQFFTLPKAIEHTDSHIPLWAMGGYIFPPISTFGSQAQRSSSGMASMTRGMWAPQPYHEAFSTGSWSDEAKAKAKGEEGLTAGGAGGFHAHFEILRGTLGG